ncbi:MAG: DUF370 domain-containing protein [Firmicutes bacterium]|nr:DUF370 domain-containing protein [Bacillota bacterium]
MFLHIGNDVMVPTKDIILIVDLRSAREGIATREFIEISEDEGLLNKVGDTEPKSLVLTTDRGYLSPISSLTLDSRSETLLNRSGKA